MTGTQRKLGLGVVTAISVLLVAWASRAGLGITPDSVAYVAGAVNVAAEWRVLDIGGQPLTLFPPGLPLLLAPAALLGWSVTSVALLLNLVWTALLVLLTFSLGRTVTGSDLQGLGIAAVVGLSPATVQTMSMLWTEPAFTVIVVGVLLLLAHGARDGHLSTGRIAAMVGLVWIAFAFRYVGLVLVPVVAVGVWIASSSEVRRWWRSAAVAALCLLVPALLVARNLLVGAGALGERYPGTQSPQGAFQRALTLWGSYITQVDVGGLTTVLGLLVAVLTAVGVILAVRRPSPSTVVAVFLVLYWASIWWSQVTTRVDVVSDRLGYPALPAMVVLAWIGASSLLSRVTRSHHGVARLTGVAVAVAAVAVVGLTWRSAVIATDLGSAPRGYAAAADRPSEISAAVADLPKGVGVAASDPWLVWWIRQTGPALSIPPVAPGWPEERTQSDLARLRDAVSSGDVSVLAYVDGTEPVMSEADLEAAGFTLAPLAELGDGRLLEIALPAGS